MEWEDKYTEPQVERVVPVYNKTNVAGLQTFLRDKYVFWASNGSNWRIVIRLMMNFTFCTMC